MINLMFHSNKFIHRMESTSTRNHENQQIRFRRFSGKGFSAFRTMHRIVSIGVLSGLTLLSVTTTTSQAQTERSRRVEPEGEEKELEGVTVTASRLVTPLNQAARQITVITQREIATAPVRSLQDLLVYSAGVDVQQRGGHGVQADISLRGGSFDQNAVLLNGVNISNPQSGHLSYDVPINLADIERIEIIHGASGLIYGSAAFTGGIHIITKQDAHERLLAQITYGQHKTYSADGRLSLPTKRSSHSVSASYKASDGYVDNTDYRQLNLFTETNYNFNSLNKVHAQIGWNAKKFGANAFYSPKYAGQYEQTDNFLVSLKGELGTERMRLIPIVYWNSAHDEYLLIRNNPAAYQNKHHVSSYGANLILAYQSAWGVTSLSTELRREEIESNKLGALRSVPQGIYTRSAQRTNASVGLEHAVQIGRLYSATAGLLLNHNTQRSGKYELMPSVSLTYRPLPDLSLSATWSTSVRIPTFVDLYYNSPAQEGSLALKAERSQSLETSIRYRKRFVEAYLTAFGLWGSDMIDWAKTRPTDLKYRAMNIGTLRTMGLEAGVKLRLSSLIPALGPGSQIRVDYARMHQEHDSDAVASLYVLRYLRDKLTLRLDLNPLEGLTNSWIIRVQKRMGQYETGTAGSGLYAHYPGYMTVDTRLDYTAFRGGTVSLLLNNITNRRYYDFAAVVQPGFWMSVGFTYRLGR